VRVCGATRDRRSNFAHAHQRRQARRGCGSAVGSGYWIGSIRPVLRDVITVTRLRCCAATPSVPSQVDVLDRREVDVGVGGQDGGVPGADEDEFDHGW
jgi:hypothetical protein